MGSDVYQELCGRLLVPDSERLARVWRLACNETEAKLLLATPGTASDLAQTAGIAADEAQKLLDGLFRKGLAFTATKPQGTVYQMPRHLIQMHDASVQWPEAPEEYYEAWRDFMANEYPALLATMLAAGFPAFMRVVPAMGTLANQPDVRADEDLALMIEAATDIAVVRCPCRLSEKRCDAPVETCVQLNNGAKYNIKRGTGRAISKMEAIEIVKDCEARGLVHTVDNRSGIGNVLCNCCTDCCAIIRPYLAGDEYRGILAPSRYTARVSVEECLSDALCTDLCPVGAIVQNEESAVVDESKCIGCGLCVAGCSVGAVSLVPMRPADFIPA